MIGRLFHRFTHRANGDNKQPVNTAVLQVTADASRCVQCGICGYNCPVGIEVREYARRGLNVTDSRCIGCSACVEKCPRGTLRWGPAILLRADNTLELNPDALPDLLIARPREVR
jgi:ferredoxin